ncbi:MAG: hypothetical protein ACM3N4_10515 [Nitrososphaerota archaeon]
MGIPLLGVLALGVVLGSGVLALSIAGIPNVLALRVASQQPAALNAATRHGHARGQEHRASTSYRTPTARPSTPTTGASSRPPATEQPVTPLATQQVYITFYAAYDNDPPGSREIAYPGASPRHAQATVDLGTYDHPITLASDQRWLPAGTRVYVVSLHKYYIMEDECVSAVNEYSANRTKHIDLYLSDSTSSRVIAAEEEATGNADATRAIVVNPPAGLPVDTTPLYSDAGGSVYAAHHYAETLP